MACGQTRVSNRFKPYPLPVRAKKADNHWLVYFANELENSVLGEFKLEKNCSQSAHPFFFFFSS